MTSRRPTGYGRQAKQKCRSASAIGTQFRKPDSSDSYGGWKRLRRCHASAKAHVKLAQILEYQSQVQASRKPSNTMQGPFVHWDLDILSSFDILI